ncbi:hypothetical protein [Kitasatospora purpeofusca]|uniref:hypothetical protein n=1 Tax=Kitasatospora purpeofusca TaxID=67352 RepID=UPI0036BA3DE8
MGTLIARMSAATRSDHGDGPGARALRTLDAVGEAAELDTVTAPLKRAVRALPLGRLRGVLHGRPLGHPLHPALVQLPVGAWISATTCCRLHAARRRAAPVLFAGRSIDTSPMPSPRSTRASTTTPGPN